MLREVFRIHDPVGALSEHVSIRFFSIAGVRRISKIPMKHFITLVVLGDTRKIDLRPEEFDHIATARRNLLVALRLEEKFDLVIANYVEYEAELLNLALHNTVYRDFTWSHANANIQTINRRLMNLLSAGRLLIDQLKHDLSIVYGPSSPQAEAVESALKQQYEEVFAFRFLEALRNHMQHRSLPIRSVNFPMRRDTPDQQEVTCGILPSVDVSQLRDDPKFKKALLKELGSDDRIVITPLVRSYVDSVGRVHDTLRNTLRSDISRWDETIQDAKSRAREVLGGELVGLAAVAQKSERARYSQIEYIFDDFIERREELQKKNPSLSRHSDYHISGRCNEDAI
ncbi:MAG: hypothetical protein ACC742_10760 [Thermoanaerobaculales bacterium]